ncbi:MAG TPA: hypothetical protein VHY83_13640 [Solirubrobacteraceae bacterium]|jgi:hypothetical protein|nr:hypothetical protein [Solirubrobacteraceae bacterium]
MSRKRLFPAAVLVLAATGAVALHASAVARPASQPRAHAASRLLIGISDNQPATFADPRFHWLGMSVARLVVPWDVVKRKTELGWQTAWLAEARAHGVKPLIVFDKDPSKPTQLPSLAAYGKAVKAFMTMFPWVRDYSPWNEENHYLEPTSRDPQRAAQYFNLLSLLCRKCNVTAADVLDISNMAEWTQKFLHYAHHPHLWGLHNYTDLSAGSHERTSLFLSIVPGAVWFTETGGVVWRYEHPNSGRRGYYIVHSESYASEVAGHLLALAHVSSRVTRVYYYQWRVPHTVSWAKAHGKLSWDSGLLRPDCHLRPAFSVLARAMGRNPSRAPRYKRDRSGDCISTTPPPPPPPSESTTTSPAPGAPAPTTTTTPVTPPASGGSSGGSAAP